MATKRIVLGEWLPDQPSVIESLQDATNVVPAAVGYIPFATPVAYSDAASQDLLNIFAGKFSAITQLFAGSSSKLYLFDGSDLDLDDVSKSVARTITNVALTSNVATITTQAPHGYSVGDNVTVDASDNTFDGTYAITTTPTLTTFTYAKVNTDVPSAAATGTVTNAGYGGAATWNFVQFGNSVLATNNVNKIQKWTIGTSGYFGDAGQYAPVAKYITVVRDFVVAANLDAGSNPNKVQWSDINDESDWLSGATSQSDFQVIADGGNITGLTGGEFGLVFLERAIVRMTYIGSPFFFQFDTISRNLGCMAGGSVAQYGNMSFFLSDNGFYSCDGATVTPIGANKVDRYFFDNADINKIDLISAAIDPERKIVVWNFYNDNNSKSLLIYNWQVQKWTICETTTNKVASIATSGITLEGLDAFGTVDSITTSFDSRIWAGGKFLFAGINGARIFTFSGQNATPSLITYDIEQGYNSVVTLARPQIDNGSCLVAVASRKELDDTITFSTPVAMSSEGRASLRSYGRYHRFKLIPTGLWTTAIGTDVDVSQQGNR
jgi:hypothetical protein